MGAHEIPNKEFGVCRWAGLLMYFFFLMNSFNIKKKKNKSKRKRKLTGISQIYLMNAIIRCYHGKIETDSLELLDN